MSDGSKTPEEQSDAVMRAIEIRFIAYAQRKLELSLVRGEIDPDSRLVWAAAQHFREAETDLLTAIEEGAERMVQIWAEQQAH